MDNKKTFAVVSCQKPVRHLTEIGHPDILFNGFPIETFGSEMIRVFFIELTLIR